MDDISTRMMVLEKEMANLKQTTDSNIQRLDNAIGELRSSLISLGEKVDDRMAELREALSHVTTGALHSVPQWAVQASERKSAIISTLAGLVCALAAAMITMLAMRLH